MQMVTSINDLPSDTLKLTFLEAADSHKILGVIRVVNKYFKQISEDRDFLHSLLVKLKGPSFSLPLYAKESEKLLAFDHEITKILKNQVINIKIGTDFFFKRRYSQARISFVRLVSPGIISINYKIDKSDYNDVYYRFSKKEVVFFNKMNFLEKDRWGEGIKHLSCLIKQFKFINQFVVSCAEHSRVRNIKHLFDNPTIKMKHLLLAFNVVDIFIGGSSFAVINYRDGREFDLKGLDVAVLEYQTESGFADSTYSAITL